MENRVNAYKERITHLIDVLTDGSKSKFAELVGVSKPTISAIFSKNTQLSAGALIYLANKSVNITWLVNGNGKPILQGTDFKTKSTANRDRDDSSESMANWGRGNSDTVGKFSELSEPRSIEEQKIIREKEREVFKKLRKSAEIDMTQSELADALGWSVQTVKNLESGRKKFRRQIWDELTTKLQKETGVYFAPSYVPVPTKKVDYYFIDEDKVSFELRGSIGKPIRQYFKNSWLSGISNNYKSLKIFKLSDDSMAPTLIEGDVLLIDYSQTDSQIGKIFLIKVEETYALKRLETRPGVNGNVIFAKSDNDNYGDWELPVTNGNYKILGRIVWYGREI
ncbi:MAG: helix-turn-helix domain-containing protein [Deltaproteobacteria bacterium]|jgi:phage repressor protein C with HTH and peptisase S24 domain|nr:helix-turn-helix domain-containing protein [Deltaproteobacteria bacterium]